MREGDRNTSFFHKRASQRCKKDAIDQLRDDEGVWYFEPDQIGVLAINFFASLFTSSNPQFIFEAFQAMESVVTDDMNTKLTQAFSSEEVKEALFQMHPTKASGQDGLSALVYHLRWRAWLGIGTRTSPVFSFAGQIFLLLKIIRKNIRRSILLSRLMMSLFVMCLMLYGTTTCVVKDMRLDSNAISCKSDEAYYAVWCWP